jgi:hypothetical protein
MTKTMLTAVALLGFSSTAFADMPKEGKYDYVSCFAGTTQISKVSNTHSISSYEFTGTTRSNLPDGPFDKESFRCIGTEMRVDGKIASSLTLCEAVDKDGNKRLARFTNDGGKITREQVTGTGKYEGATISGTVEPLGPFPQAADGTMQNCNRQTGTYKLK